MKRCINEMKLRLSAISENERVARATVCAFVATLDPTVEELADLRCAVSEAVTNAVVHAYPAGGGVLYISVRLYDVREVTVEVSDRGIGIPDVAAARTPHFTTGTEGERCGMGFLVMESFTDALTVHSRPGRGTRVLLKKILSPLPKRDV